MRVLLVSKLAQSSRAVSTIVKYAEAAGEMGHQVAVFGEKDSDFPGLEFSLDVTAFDVAIFVVYMPFDFPDLPYLATLLDGVPKERRIVIDCLGRYNETIRVEHDFNHLEKMEGHQGWEWIEAFQAVAGRVLQPTLTPLRDDVTSFLFHGYDPGAVARPFRTPAEAAAAWATDRPRKTYVIAYVGNNCRYGSNAPPWVTCTGNQDANQIYSKLSDGTTIGVNHNAPVVAPPAKLSFGAKSVANYRIAEAPQTMLGAKQKAWFLERLRGAKATWKIWGNTLGQLDQRVDPLFQQTEERQLVTPAGTISNIQ